MSKKTLFFDVESYSVTERYNMPPERFVRLGQYAWERDGEVHLTTDLEEMRAQIRAADLVVGHNILSFDLPAVFGSDSLEPLEMAMAGRVLDTLVWASVVTPAPYSYTDRKGHTYYNAGDPANARKWLGLDNLAFQYGIDGKMGDLRELAKKYNPPKTRVADLDYALIPLDDPDFLAYAVQDVVILQQVGPILITKTNREQISWPYIYREMAVGAITARITANGMNVDVEEAQARVDELAVERDEIMHWLSKEYNFPTEGKSPWATTAGKEAILSALADYGITPQSRPDWETTATGNISLGGKVLIDLTKGTEAERLGRALATLKGQRSLAQLALESVHDDGLAHPEIMAIQRSKRWSVTKPGITIWTARGPGAVEKRYFIAKPGHKMVSIDYSNADARIVAAYSGDPLYGKRFEEDEDGNTPDGHEMNGRAWVGDERYEAAMLPGWETDEEIRKENPYRQTAKILGHGWNYGGRAKTLAKQTGATIEEATSFVNNMDKAFQWLVAWQNDVRFEGKTGWVTNEWGGPMPIDEGREFTQAPALLGQNGTREVMADGLLKMVRRDPRLIQWVVAIIHDEILVDIPESELDWAVPAMVDCLEMVFHPKKHDYSAPIEMTVGHGTPADNWWRATH